jgi:hypothetical protein
MTTYIVATMCADGDGFVSPPPASYPVISEMRWDSAGTNVKSDPMKYAVAHLMMLRCNGVSVGTVILGTVIHGSLISRPSLVLKKRSTSSSLLLKTMKGFRGANLT